MLKHPKQLKYIYLLNIPKGKSGNVEIDYVIHPANEPIDIISMRTAMFTGQKPLTATYNKPIIYTILKDHNGTWMSNTPTEQMTQHNELKKCKGKVLVAGLGLGYFVKKLQEKENVTKVKVIELSKDVIKLVWKHLELDKRFSVIETDIKKYLQTTKEKYDWVYLDIWRGTGEAEFIETVLPLKRLVQQSVCKNVNHILSWQEDVMIGQFHQGLQTDVMFYFNKIKNLSKKEFDRLFKNKYHKVKRVFWKHTHQHNLSAKEAKSILPKYIKWIKNGMNGEF
jgi:hypothetical protein